MIITNKYWILSHVLRCNRINLSRSGFDWFRVDWCDFATVYLFICPQILTRLQFFRTDELTDFRNVENLHVFPLKKLNLLSDFRKAFHEWKCFDRVGFTCSLTHTFTCCLCFLCFPISFLPLLFPWVRPLLKIKSAIKLTNL